MVWWLCNHHVVLGVHVLRVYNFPFLFVLSIEIAPQTKFRNGKRSKMDPWPESEKMSTHCKVAARSWCGRSEIATG